jgi:hypothetical protein
MSLQLSVIVRNARLDIIETTIGTSATLKVLSGSMPASCAASETGTTLATIVLPTDWMANAAGGSKSLSGNWEDTSADASGVAGYFRIYDSAQTCHVQGTITANGGGGDMTVDNTNFALGQDFKVTAFSLTDANA